MCKRFVPNLLVLLPMFFLTGCADNHLPARQPGSPRTHAAPVKPPTDILDEKTASDLDTKTSSGAGGKATDDTDTTADKKTDSADKTATETDEPGAGGTAITQSDPLLGETGGGLTNKTSSDLDYDPLLGPRMPTRHSHWFSAYMGQAKVKVALNGIGMGTYFFGVTRDITQKLRPGVNMLTVTYEPKDETSWASVSVVESEHETPIPPLVSFRRAPLRNSIHSPAQLKKALKPVTQTFTFIAR